MCPVPADPSPVAPLPQPDPSSRCRRRSGPPASLALVAAVGALASACDSGTTEPGGDEVNVEVFAGADLTEEEDGVYVGGARRLQLGEDPVGLFLQHSTRYTYGGLNERVNDALVTESWYLDLRYAEITEERGDTIFVRWLDFGDVELGGTAARRTEEEGPMVTETEDHVRVGERYILNRVDIYTHRLNMDGSTVSFTHEPFYEDLMAGQAVELTASGSEDMEPTSASVTVEEGPEVVSLWNGEELDFQEERPVLQPDADLVVELDRPIDPEEALLRIAYAPPPDADVDPSAVERARAVFGLTAPTDRVVIPESALAEVASHLPKDEGGFVFAVSEYDGEDGVLDLVRTEDGTETLAQRRVSHFTFYLRMQRE